MAAAAYNCKMDGVNVLLINRNKETAYEIAHLLKSYDYKVTTMDSSLEAMLMLCEGKKSIDVMIISVYSPDLDSFKLLKQAADLDIISLFVCDEKNELLAKKALNEGAYLFVKKPLNEEIVKCLWQFVMTTKIQREKATKGPGDKTHNDEIDKNNIVGEKNSVPNIEEQIPNIHVAEKNVVSKRKYNLRKRNGEKKASVTNKGKRHINANNKTLKHKKCTEWTADLHAKFMKSLHQLGEGRCFPKEILELMNVPGLTRMQIASHLQKCRINSWKAPKERKSKCRSPGQGSSNGSQRKSCDRKFGKMPRL